MTEAKILKTPDDFFNAMIDYGLDLGAGALSDGFDSFDDVVDRVVDYWSTHKERPAMRVLHICMDVETNEPETISDVTEDVWAAAEYQAEHGYAAWKAKEAQK